MGLLTFDFWYSMVFLVSDGILNLRILFCFRNLESTYLWYLTFAIWHVENSVVGQLDITPDFASWCILRRKLHLTPWNCNLPDIWHILWYLTYSLIFDIFYKNAIYLEETFDSPIESWFCQIFMGAGYLCSDFLCWWNLIFEILDPSCWLVDSPFLTSVPHI